MTARLLVALSALVGLAILWATAPAYLTRQGFPLDDAWIHAVYAHSIAESGTLAYNPGVAATGESAPLWALVLAIAHSWSVDAATAVALSKALGFAFHVLACVVLYGALGTSLRSQRLRLAGAALAALHPDLVSASVSGMEVALAAFLAALLLSGATAVPDRRSLAAYAVLSGLALLARPEIVVLALALPLLVQWHRTGFGAAAKLIGAAAVGSGLSMGLWALRNHAVSGRMLPATFYAKVDFGAASVLASQLRGFTQLLGEFAITAAWPMMLLLAAVAVAVLFSRSEGGDARDAAAALVGGVLYCGVSFFLVAPGDPGSFYHQRYALPALPLLVAPLPMLFDVVARRWRGRAVYGVAHGTLFAVLMASLLHDAPLRYARLANDTRNIDDVQVAIGRTLATMPATHVVWATDAGAVRFFGRPFVVDLIGLNTPELLGADAQRFLDAHPADYLALMPAWTRLDESTLRRLQLRTFATSTPYTVTGNPAMRRQWLADCPSTLPAGHLTVRGRALTLRCAPAP